MKQNRVIPRIAYVTIAEVRRSVRRHWRAAAVSTDLHAGRYEHE